VADPTMLDLMLGLRFADHATAASMSTNVG
jgi:hypothetical protein